MNDNHSTEISVPACHQELPGLIDILTRRADALGIAEQQSLRLQLVVEELFLNTINHGYGCDSAEMVCIRLRGGPKEVHLRYRDSAPPFDPTPNMACPTNPDQVGGKGLHLVASMCKSLDYRREDGFNILDLAF